MSDGRKIIQAITDYQASRGGAHRAGTLTTGPLSTIKYYLEDFFSGRKISSVETGCGASTILFAHFAAKHRVYCYDDRAEPNSSVEFVMSYPGFDAGKVDWVFGPTQRTLLKKPLREPVDLVMIDGPHGFPFPEFEYLCFYPWVKGGGILVVDDIHIPTINNMFRFLCEDEMFYLHSVTDTTAFFQRSNSPPTNPEGDDWWLQRYNIQRFPCYKNEPQPTYEIPFALIFSEHLSSLDRSFQRGFIIVDGKPVTEGPLSNITISIQPDLKGPVAVEIDIECIAPDQRPSASVEIFFNLQSTGLLTFADGLARRKVTKAVDCTNVREINVKFHSGGLLDADRIVGFPASDFDKRQPGVILHSIEAWKVDSATHQSSTAISNWQGTIVNFIERGKSIYFFIDEPRDSIQAFHISGKFYEIEELDLISKFVKPGCRVLDVGANIGNHTVYFEKILDASLVIPIEPLPRAVKLLRTNVKLNSLKKIDISYLGIAFGDQFGLGSPQISDPFNLGGAVICSNNYGSIRVEPGDKIVGNFDFDLLKIDVEGQEIEALNGLLGTISRSRPVIFVEVWDSNMPRLEELLGRINYHVAGEYRRYQSMKNVILLPATKK